MDSLKLYMILLGCKPNGRNTEQHDIFFGIGRSLQELIPGILEFWPDGGTIHIDAWREVTKVDDFLVSIIEKETKVDNTGKNKLFFINLGGYKPGEFEEFHYKLLAVADDRSGAINKAKETAFYKHTGFKGAVSHVDDKYGIDVDDIYDIEDILPQTIKSKYAITLAAAGGLKEDKWQLGYVALSKLIKEDS